MAEWAWALACTVPWLLLTLWGALGLGRAWWASGARRLRQAPLPQAHSLALSLLLWAAVALGALGGAGLLLAHASALEGSLGLSWGAVQGAHRLEPFWPLLREKMEAKAQGRWTQEQRRLARGTPNVGEMLKDGGYARVVHWDGGSSFASVTAMGELSASRTESLSLAGGFHGAARPRASVLLGGNLRLPLALRDFAPWLVHGFARPPAVDWQCWHNEVQFTWLGPKGEVTRAVLPTAKLLPVMGWGPNDPLKDLVMAAGFSTDWVLGHADAMWPHGSPLAQLLWRVGLGGNVVRPPGHVPGPGGGPWPELGLQANPFPPGLERVLLTERALALLLALLGVLFAGRLAFQARVLVLAGAAHFAGSSLAAALAHELRTPMATVRLDAEQLAAGAVPEADRSEVAQRLAREAQRLDARLEEAIAISRLGGVGRTTTEPYDPGALAAGAIAEAAGALEAAGTTCRIVGAPAEGPWYGDPTALQRALTELLVNASKHGRGEVLLEHLPQGWAVRDHGPGLGWRARRKAFHAFERLGAGAQGSGLGLALVAATATMHGGRAWAEAAPGGGLRVVLQVATEG